MTINIEEYTYAKLMELALSYITDSSLDKREGSIIYDALAPFCQVLAGMFLDLYNFNSQLYVITATGENLDLRVSDIGMERNHATSAVVIGEFKDSYNNPMTISIGKRFSSISDTNPIIYKVTEAVSGYTGRYKMVCETPGSIGNSYIGPITPLEDIIGLASSEIIAFDTYGIDEETDEQLRNRYLELVKSKPFGGNIADYRNKLLNDIGGIGAVQVYPVYNGGGTVKISIVDTSYTPCTLQFIASIQDLVDPEVSQGIGLGIAPIGHTVTVVTPTEVTVNISATLTLETGKTLQDVESSIVENLTNYIQSVKESWGTSDELNNYNCIIYLSQVIYNIMDVQGVVSVSSVTVNGNASSLSLTETSTTQQLPKIGSVTLSV